MPVSSFKHPDTELFLHNTCYPDRDLICKGTRETWSVTIRKNRKRLYAFENDFICTRGSSLAAPKDGFASHIR